MTSGDLVPVEEALTEISGRVLSILNMVSQDSDVDLSGIQAVLEDIQAAVSSLVHPFLSTPIKDYTVTEGLLLLILLFLILRQIGYALKTLWNAFF